MVSVWRSEEDKTYKMFVYVPEFKVNFSSITLPILGGFNEDSEESAICLMFIYKEVVKFIEETNKARFVSTCSQLPYEQVEKLNQLAHILIDYFKEVGVNKFLPDVEKCGYFPLRPTDCIPYCQYVYEAIDDKLYDLKMYLAEKGLYEDSQEEECNIWE